MGDADNPNGTCDECGAPIADALPREPRKCSADETHDPYSDGFANGGDPILDSDGSEVPEGAELEAESLMLKVMGFGEGNDPSYGAIADAQGRIDALLDEHGTYVAVIDHLNSIAPDPDTEVPE